MPAKKRIRKAASSNRKLPSALPGDLTIAASEVNETDVHPQTVLKSSQVLAALLGDWTKDQSARWEARIAVAEPTELAHRDLQRFLKSLAEPGDTTLAACIVRLVAETSEQLFVDESAIAALKESFRSWSNVSGPDIMRVFLDATATEAEAEEFLEGLKLSPNRVFTWRLAPSQWPLGMPTFRQLLWVQNHEFIHDCIHDLGRPLPIMELGEVLRHQPQNEPFEATVRMVLSPVEFAYALSYGVFQMEVTDPKAPISPGENPLRLSLNPLFTRSR